MSNYSATVVKIASLRPHANADRLICTSIFGNNVIVGKETQIGDVGLFFPLESQLGEDFCVANDLLRRKDAEGKPAGGMFDSNRRVRCQKFRGERSEGFFIPIESLDNLYPSGKALTAFKEGDHIEEYLGKPISTKYVPKGSPVSTRTKVGRKPRESKIVSGQFHFHFDTDQLGRNIHKINPSDAVVLTWKVHGTSAIVSNCLTKKKLRYVEWAFKKLGLNIDDKVYQYIYASRRVIKNEFSEAKEHFYGEDLWSMVGKEHFEGKLHAGESVYYEIVGYTKAGAFIQKGYDYGCIPVVEEGISRHASPVPQQKVYVYRITQTSADGSIVELQWNQVRERCSQLGVYTVPEIFYGDVDITFVEGEDIATWRERYLAYLKMRFVYDQDSALCLNKVPEEGICLRKEGLNIEVYKLKSFRFLEQESKQLDTDTVDLETEQSL